MIHCMENKNKEDTSSPNLCELDLEEILIILNAFADRVEKESESRYFMFIVRN